MHGAVRLLAFAGARDALGAPQVVLELPGPCTAGDVLERVCARYPGLAPYRRCLRMAVNGSYVPLEHPVAFGDEVALIPPVSGG